MQRKKAVFNWSGGKDSALALYKVLKDDHYEVVSLLTTVNKSTQRSTMHDIPTSLLQKQAQSIGIPLYIIDLKPKGEMIDYNEAMEVAVSHFKEMGVEHFIFGDIFLHDVLSYRQKQLSPYGIEVVEPLWNKTTEQVIKEFISSGLKTVIITVTDGVLDKEFLGKTIDADLVASFPEGIDVCGENGEYHTFCYDGDIFKFPIEFSLGESRRDSFPIKLDDGTIKEYAYWFANISASKK